jgi:serine/threonine-protein kinase
MRRLTPEEQRLVVRALWIVDRLAPRIARQWPAAEADDLRSIGNLIAVEHIGEWDPSAGVSYDAYVYKRIEGAMLDHAHKVTFGMDGAVRAAVSSQLRLPAVGPGRAVAGSSEESRALTVADLRRRSAVITAATLLASGMSTGGEEAIVELETRTRRERAMERIVAGLPEDEARFAHYFFREELRRGEIAERLEVSPRTVQRLHNRVEDKIVAALESEMLRDD